MEKTEKQSGSSNLMILVAIIVAILLVGGWFIFDSYNKQKDGKLVSEVSNTVAPASRPAIVEPAPVKPVEPAVVEESVIEPAAPRYYLVMGSFLMPANADGMLEKLKERGFENAKILPELDNGFIPVSAGDFETQQEAYNFFYSTGYYYEDFWIYKR